MINYRAGKKLAPLVRNTNGDTTCDECGARFFMRDGGALWEWRDYAVCDACIDAGKWERTVSRQIEKHAARWKQ